jgi:hypothetical protein
MGARVAVVQRPSDLHAVPTNHVLGARAPRAAAMGLCIYGRTSREFWDQPCRIDDVA